MKIGIYDPYLSTLGGGEKYMLTAASCLSESNSVSLFWNDSDILQKASARFDIDLSKIRLVPNIFVERSIVNKLLQTKEYDRILYLSDGSIPGVLAKKLILHFQFPLPLNTRINIIDKAKLQKVSQIICNSFYTKEFIDRLFIKKSLVIYPPVNIAAFAGKNDKKENIILTVGRYNRLEDGSDFKKLQIMIDIFKRMIDAKQITKWKFLVITSFLENEKHYIEDMEQSIMHYPIEIITNVPNTKLAAIYSSAKVYWHAAGYREDLDQYPARVEHFGISIVEAMASGCIPIVFNGGGQKEIVKDGKNGFLWDTEEVLIDKTKQVIENLKLRESLLARTDDLEESFGEKRFYKQIQDIFA